MLQVLDIMGAEDELGTHGILADESEFDWWYPSQEFEQLMDVEDEEMQEDDDVEIEDMDDDASSSTSSTRTPWSMSLPLSECVSIAGSDEIPDEDVEDSVGDDPALSPRALRDGDA